MNRTFFAAAALGAALWLLAGCGDSKPASAPPAKTAPEAKAEPSGLAPGLMLSAAPAGAKDVVAAMKDAKEGDEVVIRGKVGGKVETFGKNRAWMLLADMSLKGCNEIPDDKCETPWDFCCEDTAGKLARIEVVGPDGKMLKRSLRGDSGIDHLAVVVVRGKAGSRDGGNLIVTASGIYIEKPGLK